jgi:predicted RNA polymerase sigma factor
VRPASDVEGLLRVLAPEVLGAMVRRHGDFDVCEDAVQEALLAAATQWPADGIPSNPRGWLVTVASRRRIELWRNEVARRRREETAALLEPADLGSPDLGDGRAADDSLTLFFLCCHPSLTLVTQVALTLRPVGGLTTAEIARRCSYPRRPSHSGSVGRSNESGTPEEHFRCPHPPSALRGSPRSFTCST